jgi:hypothetical protein
MTDDTIFAFPHDKSFVENIDGIEINSNEWKKHDDNVDPQFDRDYSYELKETKDILTQALAYKQRELSVIALVSKSKKPQNLKWEEYQHVTPRKEQLRQWFSTTDNHNVGIITGTVSKI